MMGNVSVRNAMKNTNLLNVLCSLNVLYLIFIAWYTKKRPTYVAWHMDESISLLCRHRRPCFK